MGTSVPCAVHYMSLNACGKTRLDVLSPPAAQQCGPVAAPSLNSSSISRQQPVSVRLQTSLVPRSSTIFKTGGVTKVVIATMMTTAE